jgi:RNA polymerase sigma-70 factor, ECF subfamily
VIKFLAMGTNSKLPPQLSRGSSVLQASGSDSNKEDSMDMELVATTGDQKAFKRLFDRYKGRILSYLSYLIHDQAAAEEITQEVFLKVYRFRESFERESRFTAWLWSIARNSGFDYLRRKKEILVDNPDMDDLTPSALDLDGITETAESRLVTQVDHEDLQRCLEELTLNQRNAILLRTLSDFSYEEIAKELGSTLSSVKSLINRAKTSLTDCLGRRETP